MMKKKITKINKKKRRDKTKGKTNRLSKLQITLSLYNQAHTKQIENKNQISIMVKIHAISIMPFKYV